MSEFTIHRISPELLPKFTQLYNLVFNLNYDLDFFIKKFDTQWSGYSFVGYIALDSEKEAAAYYGVYPYQFIKNGRVFIGAQIADTMTHPKHQKKGLFKTLLEKTCLLCGELGISYIYGFPNHNALPQYQKLNWNIEGKLISYTLKCNPHLLPKILRRLSSKIYSRFVYFLIKQQGATPANKFFKLNLGCFHIARIKEYFDYKNSEKVFQFSYGTSQFLIKATDFQLIIADYENEKGDLNIKPIINLGNKIGVDEIVFDLTPDLNNYYLGLELFDKREGRPIISKWISNEMEIKEPISLTGLDIDTF